MSTNEFSSLKHFDLQQLTDGVFAAIHKPGGAAYSNAGIIELGDKTLVIDSFNSVAAGKDLRNTAETLLKRDVDSLVLTHVHSDHWIGATQFDAKTAYIASLKTTEENLQWGRRLLRDFRKPEDWKQWLEDSEEQLRSETDERIRASLQISIDRTRTMIVEMEGYQPRYPDTILESPLILEGSKRKAEIRSFGAGHSKDDVAVLLPEDQIAFIGDIGFFDTQPFMGFCNLDKWRKQMTFFNDSDFEMFVPGHGPVGTKKDIVLQMEYFDVLENLIRDVMEKGEKFEEAMQVVLPEPFDNWLFGGVARFEVNVRYLYEGFGGEIPEA